MGRRAKSIDIAAKDGRCTERQTDRRPLGTKGQQQLAERRTETEPTQTFNGYTPGRANKRKGLFKAAAAAAAASSPSWLKRSIRPI